MRRLILVLSVEVDVIFKRLSLMQVAQEERVIIISKTSFETIIATILNVG